MDTPKEETQSRSENVTFLIEVNPVGFLQKSIRVYSADSPSAP